MSRGVRIVKMSGAGNDFLVLGPEEVARIELPLATWVRRVCRHGLSVGSDGVLVVEPAGGNRVRVTFHNPDGSRAFCGNGSRCAARYAHSRGMAPRSMVLETEAGDVPADVSGERVSLRLREPRDDGELTLVVEGVSIAGRRIFAGTPHLVVLVEDPKAAPLERWGPALRHHPRLAPQGANVDLVRCDGSRLTVRTWEKGVERETLACGSGALAAAAAARRRGAGDAITVLPASGIPLEVTFGAAPDVTLHGDARFLLEGQIDPEAVTGFPYD